MPPNAKRSEARQNPLPAPDPYPAPVGQLQITSIDVVDAPDVQQRGLGNALVASQAGSAPGTYGPAPSTPMLQQGVGNAALAEGQTGPVSGEEVASSAEPASSPPQQTSDAATAASETLTSSLATESAPVTEAPASEGGPEKGAEAAAAPATGGEATGGAVVPANDVGPALPGGLGPVMPMAGGPAVGGGFTLPSLPRAVDTGRPLPLHADNAAVLSQMARDHARALRDAIAASAQSALADASTRAAATSAAIDGRAAAAIAQMHTEANATKTSIDAETQARMSETVERQALAEAEYDRMIDEALVAFEAAYVIETDNIAAAIDVKANAIVAYGAERAKAVRDGVQPRIDKARTLRDEAYAPYRNHEDSEDVWEAVAEVCEEAEKGFTKGAEEVALGIEAFAREAAAAWRQEVPPNNAELTAVWDRSVEALEAERVKLKGDLVGKTQPLNDDLSAVATNKATEIEGALAKFDADVEAARAEAQARLADALTAHTMAIEAAAADTAAQTDVLEAAMLAEINRLHSDTAGIFDPEDVRPALDTGFDAIAAQWTGRAQAAETDFADESEAAANAFETGVRTSQGTATNSVLNQTTQFATASGTYMAGVATTQTDALAAAQGQVDQAAALVGADLSATAATITNTLEAGYQAAKKNIDDAEFKFSATHNSAIYKLRFKYNDAIIEALKAWYEKLWDWLVSAVKAIFGAIADFFVWVGKTIVNIVWGFIWGEAVFPEAWGAGAIVFIADVVAGLLIYGDIRDLFKWGVWKPLIKGEEWTWLNTLMITLSLVGVIPLFGDAIKISGKAGIKVLVKELGERLARELIEEFAEHGGKEIVERLVKDLGTDTIKELTERLGARGFRELLEEFGEKGVKELVEEIGAEAVGRLAKEFGPAGLKSAVEAFTGPILRDLAAELGEKALKETIDAIGTAATKEIVGAVGAAGLKDLTATFTTQGLRTLLDSATGLTAKALGELTQEFGAKALKELVDELGIVAVRELTEAAGAAGLKQLTAEFTVAGVRQLIDAATGISARAAGELARDLGAKGLKDLADELTMPVLRELADAATGIGTRSLADLAGAITRADFGRLVRKVSPAAVTQMVFDLGANRLARAINVAGYDAFARGIGRVRDTKAIAAKAASYSAQALGETIDITRRFGANTATFRVGASGAVESAEATLSQVSTGLARSGAETSAQKAVVKQAGDEGGHIIGHRFLSDQNRLNMFSQAAHLNDPVFKVLENEIATWVANGATVRMSVELVNAAAGRPSAINVAYRALNSSGVEVFRREVTFLNQAGQQFTRLSTSDILARLAGSAP